MLINTSLCLHPHLIHQRNWGHEMLSNLPIKHLGCGQNLGTVECLLTNRLDELFLRSDFPIQVVRLK
jgi:hypothetical protein